ncbi:serine/threonine-protein kinase Kist-like [Liolophura sinensis]|uniref:serine/threonine-protein kinase Kist-like n=1 Tax=Liolophura sinensis TaxID=3198878 RepID=UPI0031594B3E
MIQPGETIHCSSGQSWVISHLIGSGKCCDVYAADIQGSEEAKTAIKFYKEGQRYDCACRREKSLLNVVFQEQGPVAQLVQAKDHGVWHGRPYLVQELLSLSLCQLRVKTGEEGLTVWLCQKLVRDTLRALLRIHRSGFVHADLKPSNLMWSGADGCLKLIDFGLSFHVEDQDVGRVQSPGYEAPEAVTWNSGATCRTKLSSHIDMWSMGCLLLWMLTGKKLPQIEECGQSCVNCKTVDNKEKCKYGAIACEMIGKILSGKQHGTREAMDLITGLLKCIPGQRLSCEQALQLPFFSVVFEPTFKDLLVLPTCIVRLVNTVDRGDLQDVEVLKEIKTDIEAECSLFGMVESCVIPTEGAGVEKVFVKYRNADHAEKAFEKLNGRMFNDRTVITTFFCTEAFQNQQYF